MSDFIELGHRNEEVRKLFPKLTQIGVVVKDLEEAMRQMRDVFGMEPDFINIHAPSGYGPKTNYGKPSDFYHRNAIYHLGNIDLELLEPHGEANAVKTFLEEHGECINHLAFSTGDYDGVKKHFDGLDVATAMTGPNSKHPYTKFAYYVGYMLEIENSLEMGID